MMNNKFELYDQFAQIYTVDPSMFEKFDVKRGLRNADGTETASSRTT